MVMDEHCPGGHRPKYHDGCFWDYCGEDAHMHTETSGAAGHATHVSSAFVTPQPPVRIMPRNFDTCAKFGKGTGPETHRGCKCREKWTHEDVEYELCSTTADSDQPWCVIDGACPRALTNSESGVSVAWDTCDPLPKTSHSCNCREQWRYEGEVYRGCSYTAGREEPWCITHEGSVCFGSFEVPDMPNCHGDVCSRCQRRNLLATEPVPDAPPTAKGCQCRGVWYHNNMTMFGCSMTRDFDKPWCQVLNPESCNGAEVFNGEIWDFCTSTAPTVAGCRCAHSWSFGGQSYTGCARTPGRSDPWCEIVEQEDCAGARTPIQEGQCTWDYCMVETGPKTRSGCHCKKEWIANNMKRFGCFAGDGKQDPWCAVEEGEDCRFAIADNPSDPSYYWDLCVMPKPTNSGCQCMGSWLHEKNIYWGCVQPSGYDRPWCPVVEGSGCNGAQPPVDPIIYHWDYCEVDPSDAGSLLQSVDSMLK